MQSFLARHYTDLPADEGKVRPAEMIVYPGAKRVKAIAAARLVRDKKVRMWRRGTRAEAELLSAEIGGLAQIDVEIFKFDANVIQHHPFETTAGGPAGARIAA